MITVPRPLYRFLVYLRSGDVHEIEEPEESVSLSGTFLEQAVHVSEALALRMQYLAHRLKGPAPEGAPDMTGLRAIEVLVGRMPEDLARSVAAELTSRALGTGGLTTGVTVCPCPHQEGLAAVGLRYIPREG